MRYLKLSIIVVGFLLAMLVIGEAQIAKPHTFADGETIDAARMNANFDKAFNDALNRTGGTMTGTLTTLSITGVGTLTWTGAANVAGVLTVSSFGEHTFSAAGTGFNVIRVRNTTAGAANGSGVYLGNDASVSNLVLQSFATTYSTSGPSVADGGVLSAERAGGLSIAAIHASGVLRFFSGGTTERGRFATDGRFMVNTTIGSGMADITSDPNSFWGLSIKASVDLGGGVFAGFVNAAGGLQGSISATNSTTTAYNTTSDQRLKRSLGKAADLSGLRATVVHDFVWLTSDGEKSRGVFAQEAHRVMPSAVTKGTDQHTPNGQLAHPWGVDYSKFVPDLIVGWQQHERTIAELEKRVRKLEAAVR